MRHAEQVSAIVVGAGLMGRWHAHAIRRSGGRLAGVVDPDSSRATRLASRYSGATAYEDLDRALAALRPDFTHICTPLASHAGLIQTALAAGSHVLAEKPLASSAPETAQLLALAAKANRLLIPVHQYAWQRGSLQLLARLPSLGPLVHLRAECASAGARPDDDADAIAADILPHFLDLTRRLLGVTLAEQRWTALRSRSGEWRVTGRCGATSVDYLVSMTARPTMNGLHVLGERASARLDLFHGFVVFEGPGGSRGAKITRPLLLAGRTLLTSSTNLVVRTLDREPAYPGLIELVRRVQLAALGKGENPAPPELTLDVARTRDKLIALACSSAPGSGPLSRSE